MLFFFSKKFQAINNFQHAQYINNHSPQSSNLLTRPLFQSPFQAHTTNNHSHQAPIDFQHTLYNKHANDKCKIRRNCLSYTGRHVCVGPALTRPDKGCQITREHERKLGKGLPFPFPIPYDRFPVLLFRLQTRCAVWLCSFSTTGITMNREDRGSGGELEDICTWIGCENFIIV